MRLGRLPCSRTVLLSSYLTLFFEESSLFLQKVADILHKALLMVENVILIFDESNTEDVEDAFW